MNTSQFDPFVTLVMAATALVSVVSIGAALWFHSALGLLGLVLGFSALICVIPVLDSRPMRSQAPQSTKDTLVA